MPCATTSSTAGWIRPARPISASSKRVYYLSLEFLIGRLLFEALGNLDLLDTAREALAGLGVDLDRVRATEPDAALGNGGLGRLAACFMESMASLEVPAYGYGIRYDYGLFRQTVVDGRQHELPEDWLAGGNPWEFERPEVVYPIRFGGSVEHIAEGGVIKRIWQPDGDRARGRLRHAGGRAGAAATSTRCGCGRRAPPTRSQLETFNLGDYVGALAHRARAEAISRVLYPSDATMAGQELRLRQEYFFTSASLQDLVRRHLQQYGDLSSLSEKSAIQLNDTHPAIAVAELMRLLVDEHELPWEEAWAITTQTLSYTNHTLLPEALETWPVAHDGAAAAAPHADHLPDQLAPPGAARRAGRAAGRRHRRGGLADRRDARQAACAWGTSPSSARTRSTACRRSTPSSCARPSSRTCTRSILTASSTRPTASPSGAGCIRPTRACATSSSRRRRPEMLDDPDALRRIEPLATDAVFQDRFAAQRRAAKETLARLIAERLGVSVDPAALFDVQIKRIHEYKRQLLNILETIALYQAIKARAAPGLAAAGEDLRRQGGGELRAARSSSSSSRTTSPGS